MRLYRSAGLKIDSDIVLTGIPVVEPTGTVDVVIRRGEVPVRLDAPFASGPTWQSSPGLFRIHIPGVAAFLMRDGREIVYAPDSEATLADVPIFLIGPVFGILLHQRGQFVLHASAVRVDGRAVLFCGGSGAGKSTIAAALAQRGFPLVADDICVLGESGGRTLRVYSDGRQLKLWRRAIDGLALDAAKRGQVRACIEKYYVEPGASASESLPLGAIYALREARSPIPEGIRRPNVVDASLVLRRCAYRPLLVRRMNQAADYFRLATMVSGSAGIFEFSRTIDFARLPEQLVRIEAHWAETGLWRAAA